MYPLSILLIPFIFMIWPFLNRSRDKSAIFVSSSLALISCLVATYMMATGIVVRGEQYQVDFLIFIMVPLLFYYGYVLLKVIMDQRPQNKRVVH